MSGENNQGKSKSKPQPPKPDPKLWTRIQNTKKPKKIIIREGVYIMSKDDKKEESKKPEPPKPDTRLKAYVELDED